MIRLLGPLLVLLAACGPREPGPHSGERVVWRVDTVQTTFGACTDDADFRERLSTFDVQTGAYLAYEVADDGKSATSLVCSSFDPSTCDSDPNAVTFTTLKNQLLFTESVTQQAFNKQMPNGEVIPSECLLDLTATWNLIDEGESMDFKVDFLYGLSGSATECPQIEEQLVEDSQNGEGIDGCTVTLSMEGTLP